MSKESIWIVFLGLDNECIVDCFNTLSFEDFLMGGDIRVSFLVTGRDWEESSEIGNLHTGGVTCTLHPGGVSYLAHTHFYLSTTQPTEKKMIPFFMHLI